MKVRLTKFIVALLAAALVLGTIPAALASGSFEAVVTASKMKVYRQSAPHDQVGSLPKGTVVTVKDYKGDAALISFQGRTGIAHVSDLRALKDDDNSSSDDAPAKTEAQDDGITRYDNKSVWTKESCKVYAKPSSSSDSLTLTKGVKLSLVAVKGDWGMVQRGTNVGYIDMSHLSTSEVATAEITVETPAKSDAPSFSGSNETVIYRFLTQVMGYNVAAACGVMANIKYESDYKVTCVGDSGTSYGICQWHASRKTRLIDWCNSHGYDYTSLKGQLYFLQYELKTYYPAVHSKLKSVSNSAQGAYDAAYDFCYNFEAPASRASRSVTRANYARDNLWSKYRT